MYFVVPFSRLPSSLLARRARPKSPSLTRLAGPTRILLGLTSPWITLLECRKCQAGEAIDQHDAKLVEVHRLALGLRLEAAPHQFQDQPASRTDDIVDRDDVGVLQRGQQLGLLPVAGQLPRVGQELGVNLLDGHLAAQVAIAGAADRGKLALGDHVEDFVTVGVHRAINLPAP